MLCDSYLHPLTVLSTLPAACLGALLALILFGEQFSLIALIGRLLLIGMARKNENTIVYSDIETQRRRRATAPRALFLASLRRFRPITMPVASPCSARCHWRSALPRAPNFGVRSALPL
jgi:multidrug efflux pump